MTNFQNALANDPSIARVCGCPGKPGSAHTDGCDFYNDEEEPHLLTNSQLVQ